MLCTPENSRLGECTVLGTARHGRGVDYASLLRDGIEAIQILVQRVSQVKAFRRRPRDEW